jgi:hypothetical protein
MKNKNLISQIAILFAFLLATSVSFAQNNVEQTKINNYLESTIKYSNKLIISSTSQIVLASDIIESNLTFSTGDNGSSTIQEQYFIKSGNKLTAFRYKSDLLASNEFIESIKSKKFKLNTEDDGVTFQSMLKLIDNERGLGFFKEDNIWYFIRSEFFDDIRAYVITTDKKGQISMMVYEDELKKTLPETLLRAGEIIQDTDSEKIIISKKDSAFMHNYLLDNVNYVFEISPLDFYSINKISTISLNKCNLKVTEGDEEMTSTTNSSCMLVSSNDEYIKQASVNGLLEMPLFLKSLQEKYTLKTEDDARLFQYVLDDLTPVSSFDIELKTFHKKDNMWFFVREKSFDDLKGYILVVNDKNKVSYMEYATISEESILRIKMKDPNYKVDYKFKLVKPATNKVIVKEDKGLSVEISFDADMVNASGCWIMTRFDGHEQGMHAGSSIESPFTDGITGGALENSHHTVEYFLLKSGETNIENAVGVIKIEIEVE